MKKHLFFITSFLLVLGTYSQTGSKQQPGQTSEVQKIKYHRVFIPLGKGMREKILQLGITIDHSHNQPGGVETEISETEVKVLKDHDIPYKVLIYNMAEFYAARNAAESDSRPSAAGICNLPEIKVPSNFKLGSMGGYFTLLEMENILDKMAQLYPSLVQVKQPISTIQSFEGRNIWYVKFSDNPNVDENENEVLYTALHHAREAASLSQLIFYMWYLLENYATDPDIQETLNNSELFFVPCVNPDGYYYNETTDPNGGGMWRRNRRLNADNTYGVDLNRNYGQNWGYDNTGSSPLTSSDTYRGTAAFSEPETQAMKAFCNSREFKNALNAHTFSNVLIYPWGHIPSTYTPDNITYQEWGKLLTRDTRFLYGTCDQTLHYITNGSSDDWMYGEQSSKPKIMAMTPESGTFNDGFWPAQSRIIDICKTTFTQNFNLARLAGSYAKIYDEQDHFINANNGFIKYKLRRLGLDGGSYTVSIEPVGTGIASAGAPKVYTGMTQNQLIVDSISYTISGGLGMAQPIKYALCVNNGSIVRRDTIKKVFGWPTTVLNDNGSSATTNFDQVGIWGTTTSSFVSPPSSITESPGMDYGPAADKKISTKNLVNLQDAIYAHLQFYTKFEIEKTFDEVQIQVSTNNGLSYSPLCGKYETSPASFGGTYPVYDGRQDDWVKEEIDLSAYLGLNLRYRFTFTSDFYNEEDGFYFDDLHIRKLLANPVSVSKHVVFEEDLVLSPNPSNGIFNLHNPSQKDLRVKVYNSTGQLVLETSGINKANSEIDLSVHPAGIYFINLKTEDGEVTRKLVLER